VRQPRLGRRGEALCDLNAIFDRLPRRQWAGRERFSQAHALEQLHHRVHHRALASDVVQGEDVRVRQRGDPPRLALEPRQPVGVRREDLGQHLHGDAAAQPQVARLVHFAHAAGANRAEDLEVREACTGGQSHGRG